ncbi:MAG: YqaJ viral recombinase family protein [Defluviitaleaceae bacterium]|nr:YqaJ viral recombinase family protein [Defluviitaleaceae bacterium]
MADVLVYTESISHREWLEYRNLGIGGSDASVVCGINKWKSPIELYMEKLGMLPPSEAGEAAYWGSRLEDLVKGEFTLRTGIEVVPVNAILQHEDYPFMLANLDGVCEHPEYGTVVFEAKTAGQYMASEWGGNIGNIGSRGNDESIDNIGGCGNGNVGNNSYDKIPDAYMLQLQHYLAVTGFAGAYIAVLIGGNDFRWQFVHRDEELISMLIQLEAKFWDGVKNDMPPELDGSDASSKFLKEYFPASVPESAMILPDDASFLVEKYNHASSEIERYTEYKQEAENLLKGMMGDNEVGIIRGSGNSPTSLTDDDTIITWKSFTQERLDTKAIRSDHPSLCERYTNTKSCRRFSVKSASNDYMSNQENGDDSL